MKIKINYIGVRWMFFANFAEKLNRDLSVFGYRWEMADHWNDLRDSMENPRIDAPVQAVADMTGNEFASTRASVLQEIQELAWRRMTGVSRMNAIEGIVAIDPLLGPWFLANELRCFCDEVLGNQELMSELRAGGRYVDEAVRVAKSYAERIIRTFLMTSDAAKAEATRLREHIGGYGATQSARETFLLFRDEFDGDRRSSVPSAAGDALCRWTLDVIVSLSDAWDYDFRLVDQVEDWERNASVTSRRSMMRRILETDGERTARQLEDYSRTMVRKNDDTSVFISNPAPVYAMRERATRCALVAIQAYPPSMTAESGSLVSHGQAALALLSGVALGASAAFVINRRR